MTFSRSIRLSLIASSDIAPELAIVSSRAVSGTDDIVDASWEELLDVVYRYALRLTRNHQTACDLTQETMLRGWKQRKKLREPEAAKVWLLRIATNTWTDWQRKKANQSVQLHEPQINHAPSISKQLIQKEQVQLALATLDLLPPRQRQVLHLTTIEELSQEDVAKILDLSLTSVKSNLAAARKQMRDRLRDLYEQVCAEKKCPTKN